MSAALGRPLSRPDYLRLKAAFRRLVRAAGGLESAAMVTRVGKTELGRYQHVNEPLFAPVDVVADLEADTGEAPVTREMARMAGLAVFPLPRPEHDDPAWVGHIAKTAKECGEAVARTAEALSVGGTITADEIREMGLRQEIAEAVEALAALDAALRAVEAVGAAAPAGEG
ncbi:phage regulatory CII family protein [Oceanibacterium hippocampi]|uniref:Uncharacterized protein n=1 Tax=Oceanibacterium hippocampi TaxID=745714 RepID=A0A1Y5U3F1_9PROT|nr:phage regulatory CII family protein [Oceanibacterium hippocampi]SLN77536.1 hypothetical protein OCH7691_04449 [Oceanibacterium hippocampi]